MEPTPHHYKAAVSLPNYCLRLQEGNGKPLLILAHGFSDSGASFLRRIGPAIPERFEVLALNGLFPQPIRQENTWKEAYAWYFADLAAKKIYIHPDISANAMATLVRELGLENRRKIMVGFSQGGYFLPYLAKALGGVERMFMIGSGFRPDDFAAFQLKLPVSAVHGSADDVIPCAPSRAEFDALGAWNSGGTFEEIPGMTHALDDNGRAALMKMFAGIP